MPAKFLEALVRLAHAKFRGPDAGAAAGKKADKRKKRKGSNASECWSLAQCTEMLLERFVFPNALRSDGINFRKMLLREGVQEVFVRHKDKLFSTFAKYAAHEKHSSQGDEINLKEFTMLLNDCGLMKHAMNKRLCNGIFNNAQIARYGECAQAAESQMDREEFLEAVAAITACISPNPYIAFEQRLEELIVAMSEASGTARRGSTKGHAKSKKATKTKARV